MFIQMEESTKDENNDDQDVEKMLQKENIGKCWKQRINEICQKVGKILIDCKRQK